MSHKVKLGRCKDHENRCTLDPKDNSVTSRSPMRVTVEDHWVRVVRQGVDTKDHVRCVATESPRVDETASTTDPEVGKEEVR